MIRVGHVSPQTGPLAGFAEADPYIIGEIQKIFAGGIENNGQSYSVEIIAKDSQSNPNRAAEVASELILSNEVDIITAASTPDTTNPVADQAEVNEVPCITTDCPWQPYFFGRNGDPADGLRLDLPLLLGARGRHRRLRRAVGAERRREERRRALPQRRRRQCLGRSGARLPAGAEGGGLRADRSRPLPAAHRRFLGADLRLQGGRQRDRHRQHDPARLRHLLGAGGAAGLQARRSSRSARRCSSPRSSNRSATAPTGSPPKSGGRRTIPSRRA